MPERFENYEVLKHLDGEPVKLGRGAMGVTYKAIDVDLRCTVALKVISARYLGDESARLRFLREARASASVRHPNVASVLHLGHFRDFLLGQVDQEASQKLFNRKVRRWKSSPFRGLNVFDFATFEQNRPELEFARRASATGASRTG